MRNLSFNDISILDTKNLLPFLKNLYPFNMELMQENEMRKLVSFRVGNSFVFKTYLPMDDNSNKIRLHIYEFTEKHKQDQYSLLNIQQDHRFARTEWKSHFSADWRKAAEITVDDLLNIMKFTARLCRLRVFE